MKTSTGKYRILIVALFTFLLIAFLVRVPRSPAAAPVIKELYTTTAITQSGVPFFGSIMPTGELFRIYNRKTLSSSLQGYWNIDDVFLYDPGVKDFAKYPKKKADGVICVDVVEHIPENDVIKFIEELFKLANKFVFIVIACYPAKKTLPDGRNVHLSL